MKGNVQRELPFDAAESKTLHMRGNSMRENRETPATPVSDGDAGRSGKAQAPKPDMYGAGESHALIVARKRANKVVSRTKTDAADADEAEVVLAAVSVAAAESVEGRSATKGNAPQTASHRTQSRGRGSLGLWGV